MRMCGCGCPEPRRQWSRASWKAMAIGRDGSRGSQLRVCLEAAVEFGLDARDAAELIDRQVSTIHEQWDEAADAARLTALQRAQLWGNQILNPFTSYGWPA